jgi:hypothetical protein
MKYPVIPIIIVAPILRIKGKAGSADWCEALTRAFDSDEAVGVSRAGVIAPPETGSAAGVLLPIEAASCCASSTDGDNSSKRPRLNTAFPSIVSEAIGI